MYDIYPYYIYVFVCVSVLDANVSRRTSKKKQQRLMTLEEWEGEKKESASEQWVFQLNLSSSFT